MTSSSVDAAAPRTQQPLSPVPAPAISLLTLTILAMLCAELVWEWFGVLPGVLWLCCKWELLRGISLFCWKCIICPVSRWSSGNGRRKQRTSSGTSAVVSWDCNQDRCTAPSIGRHCISTWRALSHALQSQSFRGFAIFLQLPYLTWLLSVLRSQTLTPIRRYHGQFLA